MRLGGMHGMLVGMWIVRTRSGQTLLCHMLFLRPEIRIRDHPGIRNGIRDDRPGSRDSSLRRAGGCKNGWGSGWGGWPSRNRSGVLNDGGRSGLHCNGRHNNGPGGNRGRRVLVVALRRRSIRQPHRRQTTVKVSQAGELRGGYRFQAKIGIGEPAQLLGIVHHCPFRRQQTALLPEGSGIPNGFLDRPIEHLRLVLRLVEIQAGATGHEKGGDRQRFDHGVLPCWAETAMRSKARSRALRERGLACASWLVGRRARAVSSRKSGRWRAISPRGS